MLSALLERFHAQIRRAYPRRVRDRDTERLNALLAEMLERADVDEAERRRILLRASTDALKTLPRAWLTEMTMVQRPRSSGLGLDLRLAFRRLRRAPAYTAVAVSTLALAIGAVTAVFTAVDAFFLRPLPYGSPEELLVLWETDPGERESMTVSPANYLDWRREATTLADVAAFNAANAVLTAVAEATIVPASVVTMNFFDVLDVRPALGPGISSERGPEADAEAPAAAVVLSHGLWVRQFGADPGIIGQTIEINDRGYEVVGVMAEDFRHPQTFRGHTPADLWMPIGFSAAADSRDTRYLHVFGRRRTNASLETVRAEMEALGARLAETYPEANADRTVLVVPIDIQLFGDQRPVLLLLLGAAGVLLLVASANMASLQLARGVARERELAIQSALGSGRGSIVRQLLVEAGVVALFGGLLGAGLIVGVAGASPTIVSPYMNPLARLVIDWRILAFTLALSAGTGFTFGLLPALQLSRRDLAASLRHHGSGGGRTHQRRWLVAAEASLTVLLIFAAGLVARSFLSLMSISPGFAVDGVVLFEVRPPYSRYAESEHVLAFYDVLEERLEASPEFTAVALWSDIPLTSENRSLTFTVPGSNAPNREHEVEYHVVSHDYFEAAGIPIVEGRGFDRSDARSEPVVVVNQVLARRVFGDQQAEGQRLHLSDGEARIVGVASATIDDDLGEIPAPRIYQPHAGDPRTMWVIARTAGNARDALQVVRPIVSEVDPLVPVSGLTTMREHVGSSAARPRGVLMLTGTFGVLALLIAAIGVYGVLTSTVAERTRELGVRAALGANRRDLVSLVMKRSLAAVGAGIAAGSLVAPVAGKLVSSQLYDIRGWDPLALAVAVATVSLAALIAGWLPARRAARADPRTAMYAE